MLRIACRLSSLLRRPLGLAVLLAGLSLAVGCARPYPEAQVPRMKILVMDFVAPPGLSETLKEAHGWGPWATTIYQNPRAGQMMSERITSHLATLSFINLFSRVDLKYYFARKRQNLKEAYDYLQPADLDRLMGQVPPLDFARELGADKVISGRIARNYLSSNETFNLWSSVIDVDCELTDVASGRVEWQKHYRLRRWLASQFTAQDELSKKLTEDLKYDYFLPLAK